MRPILAGAVATLVVASSVALASKAGASKPYSQLAQTPEQVRTRANPFETDPAAIAAGRKLYERHCLECHGAEGKDGNKGPGLRVAEIQGASPGALFWVITNGNVRAGMPVWSKLPEPQRWQIVSYLRSLGAVASTALPVPDSKEP